MARFLVIAQTEAGTPSAGVVVEVNVLPTQVFRVEAESLTAAVSTVKLLDCLARIVRLVDHGLSEAAAATLMCQELERLFPRSACLVPSQGENS